jgi:hypothetical protein
MHPRLQLLYRRRTPWGKYVAVKLVQDCSVCMVDERFCNLETNYSFVGGLLQDKFVAVKRLQPFCGDCKPAVFATKVYDCAVVFGGARATVKHCCIGHHCRPCYMRIVEKMTVKNTMYMDCNGHKQLFSATPRPG